MNALIVLENVEERVRVRNLFALNGFHVQVLTYPQEAVLLYQGGGVAFDIILMDVDHKIYIPDGVLATLELRTMGVGSVIAGLSLIGGAETLTENDFPNSGLDDYNSSLAPLSADLVEALFAQLTSERHLRQEIVAAGIIFSVLVIDNDQVFERFFGRIGCDARTVNSGPEALALQQDGPEIHLYFVNVECQEMTQLQAGGAQLIKFFHHQPKPLSTYTRNTLLEEVRKRTLPDPPLDD